MLGAKNKMPMIMPRLYKTGATGAGGREYGARPTGTPAEQAAAAKRGMEAGFKALAQGAKQWAVKDAIARGRANAARGTGTGRNMAPLFMRLFKQGAVRLGTRTRKTGPGAGRLG
jgi:hypothetical protein